MKFMAGYQLVPDGTLVQAIIANREHIHEVYFPWEDLPNGRSALTERVDLMPFEAQQQLVSDLRRLSEYGIGLGLLLNGNCYGRFSQSRQLFSRIGDAVDYLINRIGNLRSVTTTSPLIARFVHANFPSLEVRASVNMEIGTVQGMDYIADCFDGYYLRRDLNRNLTVILELKAWCEANGKALYMLANSGCLNHCSVHNFHDNLVAHENEIQGMDNAYEFRGMCHGYLSSPEKQVSIIRDTGYVRPEDIRFYEAYFSAVKLATRINRNPVAVLEAYIRGSYSGNIMELLEPNHAEAFYPAVIENSRFPSDFAEKTMTCDKQCGHCGYCGEVFKQARVDLGEIGLC